jgi:tRNA (cmo5U34)-methyltransferase
MGIDADRDIIFNHNEEGVESFTFDKNVVKVFPDMIKRSVPGYVALISLIGVTSAKYAVDNTNIYDLGCSLGAVSASIIANLANCNCKIIAADLSSSMVTQCRENLSKQTKTTEIVIKEADIRDLPIENASVVALNYTLQFIPINDRKKLIKRIYDGLNPGGILILSEKILLENRDEQKVVEELHKAFKKANGYSELEIAQKRNALENVLIAENFATHKERLTKVGFSTVVQWFQCMNFHSILAIK